jgi:hypothetical protein
VSRGCSERHTIIVCIASHKKTVIPYIMNSEVEVLRQQADNTDKATAPPPPFQQHMMEPPDWMSWIASSPPATIVTLESDTPYTSMSKEQLCGSSCSTFVCDRMVHFKSKNSNCNTDIITDTDTKKAPQPQPQPHVRSSTTVAATVAATTATSAAPMPPKSRRRSRSSSTGGSQSQASADTTRSPRAARDERQRRADALTRRYKYQLHPFSASASKRSAAATKLRSEEDTSNQTSPQSPSIVIVALRRSTGTGSSRSRSSGGDVNENEKHKRAFGTLPDLQLGVSSPSLIKQEEAIVTCEIREKEQQQSQSSERQRTLLVEENQALKKEIHKIKAQLKQEQRYRAMEQAQIADLEARARFNLFSSDLSSDQHQHRPASTSASCWSLDHDAMQISGSASASATTSPSAWLKQFETLKVLDDVNDSGATRRGSTGTASSREDSTVSISAAVEATLTSTFTPTSMPTPTFTPVFVHATTFQKPLKNRFVGRGAAGGGVSVSVASESTSFVSNNKKKHVISSTSETSRSNISSSKGPRAWLKQLETLNDLNANSVGNHKNIRHRNIVRNDRTCNRNINRNHASNRNKENSSSSSAVVEAAPTHQYASASNYDACGYAATFHQMPLTLFARGGSSAAGGCESVAPETRAPTQHSLGSRVKEPDRRSSVYSCPLFSSNNKQLRRRSPTTNTEPERHALLCPSTLKRLGDQMDQWDIIPMTCTATRSLTSSHLEKRILPPINKDTIVSSSVYGTANNSCSSKSCSSTRTTTTCRPSLLSLLRRGGARRSGGASMIISSAATATTSSSSLTASVRTTALSRTEQKQQIKANTMMVLARAQQKQHPSTTIARAKPTSSAAAAAVTSDCYQNDAMDMNNLEDTFINDGIADEVYSRYSSCVSALGFNDMSCHSRATTANGATTVVDPFHDVSSEHSNNNSRISTRKNDGSGSISTVAWMDELHSQASDASTVLVTFKEAISSAGLLEADQEEICVDEKNKPSTKPSSKSKNMTGQKDPNRESTQEEKKSGDKKKEKTSTNKAANALPPRNVPILPIPRVPPPLLIPK